MLHQTIRARPGRLLFVTWEEARALWDRVVAAAPGLHALCLMPDHVHLLHDRDLRRPLGAAMSGHARWLAHRRAATGPLIRPLEAPDRALTHEKRLRSVRYVHLNPCRARLVADPLAWPFSTHRDAVGLAVDPVVPRQQDPVAFHRVVSSDPAVNVEGTELPVACVALPDTGQVLAAVSALARRPLRSLADQGPDRDLVLRAARTHSDEAPGRIARQLGVHRSTVHRTAASADRAVALVARVVGDPRFQPLLDGDLRRSPGWWRYRERT